MRIVRKDDIQSPVETQFGEKVYEMIGRPEHIGGTVNHSFVYVVIPPNGSSVAHYHRVAEETYYMLKGKARLVINENEFILKPEDACLIMPGEVHQIFNIAESGEVLEFVAVCAPAWVAEDSYPVDK